MRSIFDPDLELEYSMVAWWGQDKSVQLLYSSRAKRNPSARSENLIVRSIVTNNYIIIAYINLRSYNNFKNPLLNATTWINLKKHYAG